MRPDEIPPIFKALEREDLGALDALGLRLGYFAGCLDKLSPAELQRIHDAWGTKQVGRGTRVAQAMAEICSHVQNENDAYAADREAARAHVLADPVYAAQVFAGAAAVGFSYCGRFDNPRQRVDPSVMRETAAQLRERGERDAAKLLEAAALEIDDRRDIMPVRSEHGGVVRPSRLERHYARERALGQERERD